MPLYKLINVYNLEILKILITISGFDDFRRCILSIYILYNKCYLQYAKIIIYFFNRLTESIVHND
jgi:hypothetical protein